MGQLLGKRDGYSRDSTESWIRWFVRVFWIVYIHKNKSAFREPADWHQHRILENTDCRVLETRGRRYQKADEDCLLAPLLINEAYIGVTEQEHTGVKIPINIPVAIPTISFLFNNSVIKEKYLIFLT